MLILIEGSLVIKFVRREMNTHLDSNRAQAGHVLAIEIRDRAREQRNVVAPSFAGSNGELMRDEVELDLKTRLSERNGRRSQAAGCDVEGHIPPMILQRGESQTGLAHDLGPHVERVAGFLPVGEGK